MRYLLDRSKVRELALKRGYPSLGEVAAKAGVHRNTLQNYLSGRHGIFPESVEKIARVLEADPLTLVTLESSAKNDDAVQRVKGLLTSLFPVDSRMCLMLIGSRVHGTQKKWSDIDLALCRGATPLSTEEYLKIREQIECLVDDLPWSVDVINLDQAPAWFMEELLYDPVFLLGDRSAYTYCLGALHGIKKGWESKRRSKAA